MATSMPGLRRGKVGEVRSRSLVHMLQTFAVRLESDHGPKEAVKAIELLAKDRTIRRAEHRDWNAQEAKRVEQQREAFRKAKSGTEIKNMLLQRAYDLLWDGDFLACDALIEFLPESDADKMMSAWSDDEDGKEPRSQWYEGRAA